MEQSSREIWRIIRYLGPEFDLISESMKPNPNSFGGIHSRSFRGLWRASDTIFVLEAVRGYKQETIRFFFTGCVLANFFPPDLYFCFKGVSFEDFCEQLSERRKEAIGHINDPRDEAIWDEMQRAVNECAPPSLRDPRI